MHCAGGGVVVVSGGKVVVGGSGCVVGGRVGGVIRSGSKSISVYLVDRSLTQYS